MIIKVIKTGSSGNCTVINGQLALDMGIPFKLISERMYGLRVVFIGHEHGDHFNKSTVARLAGCRPALRFCGGEWMVPKFLSAGVKPRNIDILRPGNLYDYGAFRIEPVELFHDVPCYGCKIYANGEKACYFVDTGHLDGIEAKDFDYYLVEANHKTADLEQRVAEKTEAGLFAYEIRAAANHLSFEQATDWLCANMTSKSVWIPMHQHQDPGGNEE